MTAVRASPTADAVRPFPRRADACNEHRPRSATTSVTVDEGEQNMGHESRPARNDDVAGARVGGGRWARLASGVAGLALLAGVAACSPSATDAGYSSSSYGSSTDGSSTYGSSTYGSSTTGASTSGLLDLRLLDGRSVRVRLVQLVRLRVVRVVERRLVRRLLHELGRPAGRAPGLEQLRRDRRLQGRDRQPLQAQVGDLLGPRRRARVALSASGHDRPRVSSELVHPPRNRVPTTRFSGTVGGWRGARDAVSRFRPACASGRRRRSRTAPPRSPARHRTPPTRRAPA